MSKNSKHTKLLYKLCVMLLRRIKADWLPYSTLFTISASTLFLEILSMRTSSIAFGLDYQFFTIPLALFGLGFGGLFVFMTNIPAIPWRRLFPIAALYPFFVALPFILVPDLSLARPIVSKILFFGLTFSAYALAGFIISSILARQSKETALTYSIDLAGAAAGAFTSVFLLHLLGYEKSLLWLFVFSIIPLVCLVAGLSKRPWPVFIFYTLVVLTMFLLPKDALISHLSLACTQTVPLYRTSNAFANLEVRNDPLHAGLSSMQELGAISAAALPFTNTLISMDCISGITPVIRYNSIDEVASLKNSLRGIAFEFSVRNHNSAGAVLIPGSGGGIDIIRAILFNAKSIDAVEFNPLIVETSKKFSNADTYPYSNPAVRVVIDDSRRFIESATTTYDLILSAQPSHYGSGTYHISSASYSSTQEAHRSYLAHLNPGGVLALTRFDFDRGFTAEAEEAMRSQGLDPSRYIVRIIGSNGRENLSLLRNDPFTDSDLSFLRTSARQRGFTLQTDHAVKEYIHLTDDRPLYIGTYGLPGDTTLSMAWRMFFEIVLLGLAVFIIAFMLPIVLDRSFRSSQGVALIGFYTGFFVMTGIGFIIIELAVIQKVTFLLANPVYAVALSLTSVLFFGGLGSLTVQLLRYKTLIHWATVGLLMPVIACIFYADIIIPQLLPLSVAARSAFVVLALALPSFCMGMFFPSGLQRIGVSHAKLVPWAWGVSGMASVLGGLMEQTLALQVGLRITFLVGIIAYILAWFCFRYAHKFSCLPQSHLPR